MRLNRELHRNNQEVVMSTKEQTGVQQEKVGRAKRFFRYVNDPNVGKLKKFGVMVVFAVLIASPIDFIPDLIPVAGQADDLAYLAVDIMAAVSLLRGFFGSGSDER
jgi:uncharacterized membrane protein YkvA (DUF1232 family)